jgi:hypothetical protein
MDKLAKKFCGFLYSEYSVTGANSYDRLTEAERNGWRAEYCREYPDVLDDVNYIASDLLARRLEAVFSVNDGGVNAAREKLAAYAALGKAVADVVARKADEAGEEWVDEGWSDGLFKEFQEGY